jgi:hypothetical protein
MPRIEDQLLSSLEVRETEELQRTSSQQIWQCSRCPGKNSTYEQITGFDQVKLGPSQRSRIGPAMGLPIKKDSQSPSSLRNDLCLAILTSHRCHAVWTKLETRRRQEQSLSTMPNDPTVAGRCHLIIPSALCGMHEIEKKKAVHRL